MDDAFAEDEGDTKGCCGKLSAAMCQKGGVLPMTVFLFLEVCCFLLAQVGAQYVVLSQYGVDSIPYMYIGVAAGNILIIPVFQLVSNRVYQRKIVFWSVVVTVVLLVGSRLSLLIYPELEQYLGVTIFIIVELVAAYDPDQFWGYVEESCTLQQAKRLFNTVNYGAAIANGFIGIAIFAIPWSNYMRPESLLLVAAGFLLPNVALARIVAPKSKQTGADHAKDRVKLMKQIKKRREKDSRAHAKAVRKGTATVKKKLDLSDGDFEVADGKQRNIILQLLFDAMVPSLAVGTTIMFMLDTLYNWQFFSILENKIAVQNPDVPEDELDEIINQQIAEYTGLISAGSVVLNLPLQKVTSTIMQKYGIFACSLNLPIVMVGFAVMINTVTDLNTLLATRAVYMCFYLLNFGFTRVIWYAVPESIKSEAMALCMDFLPAAAKAAGAILTLVFIENGVAPSDLNLCTAAGVAAIVWGLILLFYIKKGYMFHLMNSIQRRAMGDGSFQFDVNNAAVVQYVRDFIILGDSNQRVFIFNTLRNVPLDKFQDLLRDIFVEKPATDVMVALVELCRTDNRVIRDTELLAIIHNSQTTATRVLSGALVACGERKLRKAKEDALALMDSEAVNVRVAAAIAVLHLQPDKGTRTQVRDVITKSLALTVDPEDRRVCLRTLSIALTDKNITMAMPAGFGGGGRMQQMDFSKMPRQRSKLIRSLRLDYVLPMCVQNLTHNGSHEDASKTLEKFDSREIQHLFKNILTQDAHGMYFVPTVFKFLTDNSSRVDDNEIVNTLLAIPLLTRPDQIGSSIPAMVFRTIIAIARTTPLNAKQEHLIKRMITADLSRAYRKISLIFWLSSVPFSAMLNTFLQHQFDLTLERIFLLLACLLPYDPVDEYAETIMNADDKDMHANALEVLEGISPRDVWAMLFPLIDPENDLKEKLKFGRQFYPGLQDSIDATLEEYLLSPSEIWPAFILDICVKNELYDFLDSINWAAVCQSVKDLHDEKGTGRLVDGAHLMLEIVCKDSSVHRSQTKQIKEKVKRAMRFEKLERENFITRKKQRRKMSMDAKSQGGVKKLKTKAYKSLFGAKVNSSQDLLTSSDGMMSSNMNSSMWMSTDNPGTATEQDGSTVCCCFGNKNAHADEEDEAGKNKEAKLRHQESQRQRKLKRKVTAEGDVRFNLEYAGILPANLHTPVARERKRYQLLMKQHRAELGIVAPHIVEIDIDSDEYYKQNWDKGPRTIQGRKKGRLKNLMKKKKKDDKMLMSSADGGNMMVLTNPDVGEGVEDSNDEPVEEVDVCFPRVADQLKELKAAYDQGTLLDSGRDELESKKNEILGVAAVHSGSESPDSAEPPSDVDAAENDAATPDESSPEVETAAPAGPVTITTASPKVKPSKKGKKGKNKKGGNKKEDDTAQQDAETSAALLDRPLDPMAQATHTISRYFESSPMFAEFEPQTHKVIISHRFEIGDHCVLSPDGNRDGCLAGDEIGEIWFDLSGYNDDSLVIQVHGPRGDTWWYSIADLEDGNAVFEQREKDRLAEEAAALAEIAAAEAEVLRAIAEEEAAVEAERIAFEEEEARIAHEEEQAQIAATIFADEEGAEEDEGEKRPRTKKEIAGKVAWTGTKLGAKATYHVSKAALKTTAKVSYKVAKDDRTHKGVKGLAKATVTTTKYSAKGTAVALKHATPVLYDATKMGARGAMTATSFATKTVASSAATALVASKASKASKYKSSDHSDGFSESLDSALKELEAIQWEEAIQLAIQDEMVKLRWLADEEVITDDELHRQATAIQTAVDATKAKREADAQAELDAANRIDPREELEHWMETAVRLGKTNPELGNPHANHAALLYQHGIQSLGELRFQIRSDAIGIIDLLDYGIETQHHSTAIWTAMHNAIQKEVTYAAMHIQRRYRYKKWATAVTDARLTLQKENTAAAAIELGQRHLQKSRWQDALEAFQGALELDPENEAIPDGLAQAKQGLELKDIKKQEGKKFAKAKRMHYDDEWTAAAEQKRMASERVLAALKLDDGKSMLKRQATADALLQQIESGEWDEQKKHEKLQARQAAEALEDKKKSDVENRIKQERADKEAARKAQIAFEKSERKRLKQEAIDSKREAKEAVKQSKLDAKEAQKKNELEAKEEKAAIDAETKQLKMEEKEEKRLMKNSASKGKKSVSASSGAQLLSTDGENFPVPEDDDATAPTDAAAPLTGWEAIAAQYTAMPASALNKQLKKRKLDTSGPPDQQLERLLSVLRVEFDEAALETEHKSLVREIKAMKKKELVQQLSDRGLDVKGKPDELLARLLEAVNADKTTADGVRHTAATAVEEERQAREAAEGQAAEAERQRLETEERLAVEAATIAEIAEQQQAADLEHNVCVQEYTKMKKLPLIKELTRRGLVTDGKLAALLERLLEAVNADKDVADAARVEAAMTEEEKLARAAEEQAAEEEEQAAEEERERVAAEEALAAQLAAEEEEDAARIAAAEEEDARLAEEEAKDPFEVLKRQVRRMPKKNLKKHLEKRGLGSKGSHDILLARLLLAVEDDHNAHREQTAAEKIVWEAEQEQLAGEMAEREAALAHLGTVKAEYTQLKAPALRELLDKRGLKTSGKKTQLLERLADALDLELEATLEQNKRIAAREDVIAGIAAEQAAADMDHKKFVMKMFVASKQMKKKELVQQLGGRGLDVKGKPDELHVRLLEAATVEKEVADAARRAAKAEEDEKLERERAEQAAEEERLRIEAEEALAAQLLADETEFDKAAKEEDKQFDILRDQVRQLPKKNLKKHLEKRGLSSKGAHDVLLDRLLEAIDEDHDAHREQTDIDRIAWEAEQAELAEELAERETALAHLAVLNSEYAELKAPALRELLAERGLKTSGKKTKLLGRLADALEAEMEKTGADSPEPIPETEPSEDPEAEGSGGATSGTDADEARFEELKADYAKMPKKNLKKHLEKRGLGSKGAHDDLLARLLEDVRTEVFAHEEEAKDGAELAEWEEEQAEVTEMSAAREAAEEKLRGMHAEFADLKAPALRKELEGRGLETGGKKTALLERLAAFIEKEHAATLEKAAEEAEEAKAMPLRNLRMQSMDRTMDFVGLSQDAEDAEGGSEGLMHLLMRDGEWESKYFRVRGRRLDVYPDEGAVDGDDYVCKVPMDTLIVNTKYFLDERPNAFSISISDQARITGDVVKQLVVEPGTADERERWVGLLEGAVVKNRARKIQEDLLNQIYHDVDGTEDGMLNREEIGALVEKVGMSLDISQLTVLFLSMDLDKSGLIDWKEFLAWYYSPIDESEGPTDHGRLKKKLVLQVGRAAAETSDWLLHIFKKYDSDANGALDLEEMGLVAADLGLKLSAKELADAFGEMDGDGDGEVDFDEFKNWHDLQNTAAASKVGSKFGNKLFKQKSKDERRAKERARVREMFEKIDSDGNGIIDPDEFKLLLAELGLFFTLEELDEAFNAMDEDSSEGIDFEEFLDFYEGKRHTATTKSTQKIRKRMLLLFKKDGADKRTSDSGSLDDALKVSAQGMQQLQGTKRRDAQEQSYEFSTFAGSYSVLQQFGLKALKQKEKEGFTTVDKLVFLQQNQLFQSMEITEVLRIAQVCEQINMRTDDVLFEDGDAAYCAYFIMSGELKLSVQGVDIPLKSREKPFGEVSLLYNRPRAGKCVAGQNTVLLCLMRADLLMLFAKQQVSEPDFMRALSVLIVNSLRNNYRTLETKQSSGSVGSSLALEVARAGWGYDATDFLYVGKARTAFGYAQTHKHDLEQHIEKIARLKHMDAAVLAPESYSTVEKIILLKSCKLFESSSDKTLGRVSEVIRMIRVPEGMTLYTEGDPGQDAFIVATGQVKLMRNGAMIGLRDVGTVNGATALVVAGDPRSATAIATKETVIMSLSAEALEGIMEEQEELRIAMMKVLSDRLFDSYGRMNVISKVEQRRDYFAIFKEDLRLDVRNLRRFQNTDFDRFFDSSDEEDTPVDRSMSRLKRAEI